MHLDKSTEDTRITYDYDSYNSYILGQPVIWSSNLFAPIAPINIGCFFFKDNIYRGILGIHLDFKDIFFLARTGTSLRWHVFYRWFFTITSGRFYEQLECWKSRPWFMLPQIRGNFNAGYIDQFMDIRPLTLHCNYSIGANQTHSVMCTNVSECFPAKRQIFSALLTREAP